MGRQLSTLEERIQWMLKNSDMWDGWQGEGDPRKHNIVHKMKKEGMVARSTHYHDVKITRLIHTIGRRTGSNLLFFS